MTDMKCQTGLSFVSVYMKKSYQDGRKTVVCNSLVKLCLFILKTNMAEKRSMEKQLLLTDTLNTLLTVHSLGLYLVGFFIFAEISKMLKKNRLEKLVSPMKWSAWVYRSTLQNFAGQHSFDVNGVSVLISWVRDVKTGENMWKVLKTKAWA